MGVFGVQVLNFVIDIWLVLDDAFWGDEAGWWGKGGGGAAKVFASDKNATTEEYFTLK